MALRKDGERTALTGGTHHWVGATEEKLVRGVNAAKYMVNFAVAMVFDATIRGGMRRVNVRDAACSRYDAALTILDAALTTFDAALTTLDAALKILEAAALRHHPAGVGTYSQMKHIIIIIIFYPARSLALMASLNAN
ncbi:hypothetical protein C8J57DRAFT_1526824 [Mycena rebaudengoi]|nr:hypothetical protein C8J57DRAFT_1526824 [Mycena rebaudengoi]